MTQKYIEIKSPGLAAVLSAIFPGLGQLYNGMIGKGLLFMFVGMLLIFSMTILIGIFLYPIFWAINIYDAYQGARDINQRY